ncbi:TetR family transcriptional regulator [Paractinoplanes abujensis]|uniref:AcrR family transcriptional regulator n=1 Tax=Paractinoplanes abujensis TaxID=882441 RepID=A0A7W7CRC2_9ACTN|nr:TetR/AcrR family transcriptional regulator [Actinoplanes abujensis]MBB4693287.1 AcrR family transcriptional regulator [Actinoplanes abujensis]GID24487.1 TetR family transcriptional regulator [Actinoplanes abujensis]
MPAHSPSPHSPESPTPDRRARQRERRRAEIYTAALELFVERTYDGTTMEDIADRADVARATVFNHFSRKAAFLQEWAALRREQALKAAYAGGPDSPIREVLVRFFTEIGALSSASRPESVAVILESVRLAETWQRPPLAAAFAAAVVRAQQSGEIDPAVNADRVGLTLASSYYATLTAWASEEPAPFDLSEEMAATVDLLLNGVLPRTDPAH